MSDVPSPEQRASNWAAAQDVVASLRTPNAHREPDVTAPHPRPVVDREALVTEVVAKFHVLHPRIPDLDKGDCHCELLAQLAVDAVLAALTR